MKNITFSVDDQLLLWAKEKARQEHRSLNLVKRALNGEGCISRQVIEEFANAALRMFSKPMSCEQLKGYIDRVLLPLCTIWPDEEIYREALITKVETGYSWYDSLIAASALRSGVAILYSEDLQDGPVLRGMKIRSPF